MTRTFEIHGRLAARSGERISPERESMVHLAGFAVLVGLLMVISFLDISRLFSGESFF